MANICADEILPSPQAGRWQQSLWRHLCRLRTPSAR